MSLVPHERAESIALQWDCGFVGLPNWTSITLTGSDRRSFLHNFCTNDVRRLLAGENCEAFITNAKGKILGHGLVTCRETELVLITVPGQGPSLTAHFDRYIIREDVQVRDTTADRSYLLVTHTGTIVAFAPKLETGQSWLRSLANSQGRLRELPIHWIRWDLLGPNTMCGLLEVSKFDIPRARQQLIENGLASLKEAAFHVGRIEAGMPLYGFDFDESNFPQEVGRDREAISFTKGCYLGQETVARIDALGHVNQRLGGVRFFAAQVPETGMKLQHAGKEVGRVTSAAFSPRLQAPLALAMLRREANTVGTRLESPVGACEVIALPLEAGVASW